MAVYFTSVIMSCTDADLGPMCMGLVCPWFLAGETEKLAGESSCYCAGCLRWLYCPVCFGLGIRPYLAEHGYGSGSCCRTWVDYTCCPCCSLIGDHVKAARLHKQIKAQPE
jgi:hypothetical protein